MGGAGGTAGVTRLVFPHGKLKLGRLVLPREVAHHARVARVAPGEPVEVLDLAGTVALGRMRAYQTDGSCEVEVMELVHQRGEPPVPLTLALAVLHTQAFDWAVEKATELGATSIQPLLTQRVQRRPHELRVGRWQRVAQAAVAQCGRSCCPQVLPPRSLASFLAEGRGVVVVADFCGADPATWSPPAAGQVTVVVGPEGGFTEQERQALQQAGAVCVFLGPRTLRAETAAVVMLALVQARLGWWTK